MESKAVTITPQRLHIVEEPPLVRAMLGTPHSWLNPSSPPTTIDMAPAEADIELVWHTSNRFIYRHRGMFAGAWQEIAVLPANGGTGLVCTAGFVAVSGSDHRGLRLRLEQVVRQHLLKLADAIEARAARKDSVRDLQAAVASQEEAEWGEAGHSRGVERMAVDLANAMLLPPRQIAYLQQAAQLHDVGKIALDSSLWTRRGVLIASHRAAMEAHAQMGFTLAARAGLPESALLAIRHHHERWDGQGYPSGLAGEDIPLKARVLFLAEVTDSMLRPSYRRRALPPEEVIQRLKTGAGREWDPQLVRLAERIIRDRRDTASFASRSPATGEAGKHGLVASR